MLMVVSFNLHKLNCTLCQKKGQERNNVADGAAYGPALPVGGNLPCSGVRWKASLVALCLPKTCATIMLFTVTQTLSLWCAGGAPSPRRADVCLSSGFTAPLMSATRGQSWRESLDHATNQAGSPFTSMLPATLVSASVYRRGREKFQPCEQDPLREEGLSLQGPPAGALTTRFEPEGLFGTQPTDDGTLWAGDWKHECICWLIAYRTGNERCVLFLRVSLLRGCFIHF